MQIRAKDIGVLDGLERSILVIAVVLRMLIGLGLAIALFLQVYMAILTDHRCVADVDTLGNTIRCADPLNLIAGAVFLVAGLGLAAAFFTPRRVDLPETLLMLMIGVAISFLSGLSVDSATWQTALVILSLFAAIGGLLGLRIFTRDRGAPPS